MHEKVTYQLPDIDFPSGEGEGGEAIRYYLLFKRKLKQIWQNNSICLIFEESTWESDYCLFPLLLYWRSRLAGSPLLLSVSTEMRKFLSFK